MDRYGQVWSRLWVRVKKKLEGKREGFRRRKGRGVTGGLDVRLNNNLIMILKLGAVSREQ